MIKRNPYALYVFLLPSIPVLWFSGGGYFLRVALTLILYLVFPFLVALAMGFKPGEVGFRVPSREGLKRLGILVMVASLLALCGLTIPEMRDYYPIFEYSNWADFALKELGIGAIMLAHEAFYRGFLLFPLSQRNENVAIIAQLVPYVLVHIGKPMVEVPFSFVAGVVFAKLDLKAGSFVPSFILHWFGATLFDVLCALGGLNVSL